MRRVSMRSFLVVAGLGVALCVDAPVDDNEERHREKTDTDESEFHAIWWISTTMLLTWSIMETHNQGCIAGHPANERYLMQSGSKSFQCQCVPPSPRHVYIVLTSCFLAFTQENKFYFILLQGIGNNTHHAIIPGNAAKLPETHKYVPRYFIKYGAALIWIANPTRACRSPARMKGDRMRNLSE